MNKIKNEILSMINRYRQLIDFDDKMEKSNYKFVERYFSNGMKKGEYQDVLELLKDAVDLAEKWILYKEKHKAKFQ